MTQQYTLILRGLELKMDRILDFLAIQEKDKQTQEKVEKMELGEWVTLTQAWELQGKLFTLSTMRTRADLQSCMGRGVMIGRTNASKKKLCLNGFRLANLARELCPLRTSTRRSFFAPTICNIEGPLDISYSKGWPPLETA